MLANLRNMALDMNAEIRDQNEQMDRIAEKVQLLIEKDTKTKTEQPRRCNLYGQDTKTEQPRRWKLQLTNINRHKDTKTIETLPEAQRTPGIDSLT